MRLFAGFLLAPLLFSQTDGASLLRESVKNYDRDWRSGLAWAYVETDVSKSEGEQTVNISEIVPIGGTPYERIVEKDNQKLTGDEARREQEKMERVCRERQNESPAQHAARLRKYAAQRAFVHEVPKALDAKLVGEDTVDGRPAWVLELTPHPGYVPSSTKAAMLKHMRAKLWIDKQDLRWSKAEAHVIDTISIGWVLARIGPGAVITFEQMRVADDFWMPKRVVIQGVAKIFLVHDKNLDETITFSQYHQQAPVLTADTARPSSVPVSVE